MAEWGCNARVEVDPDAEEGEDPFIWVDEAEQPIQFDGEDWYQCPARPIKDDPFFFAEAARLWSIKEKGYLPYPGSYFEQPNLVVEVWRAFDRANADVEKQVKARHDRGGGS